MPGSSIARTTVALYFHTTRYESTSPSERRNVRRLREIARVYLSVYLASASGCKSWQLWGGPERSFSLFSVELAVRFPLALPKRNRVLARGVSLPETEVYLKSTRTP